MTSLKSAAPPASADRSPNQTRPMIFPLPRLQPGWLLSETVDLGHPSVATFLQRLSDNRWQVLRLPYACPELPRQSDLLFIDLAAAGIPDSLDEAVENALKNAVPVLFHGPAALITQISRRLRLSPLLLKPDDLPRWWGPERMDEELIRNTPPLPVTSVTLGRYWAIVETHDSMGLASMAHSTSGIADQPESIDPQDLVGVPLSTLAEGLRAPGGLRRTLACAAVNAGMVPPSNALQGDGLLSGTVTPDRPTVIVGRFPALQSKRPGAIVLEMSPGPEDLPAEAAPHVIPGAGDLVVTASAWCNGTLSGLLRLATNVPVTLVGPGTPLSPALHAYGIKTLAGFIAIDRDAIRSVIANGGGVKAFKEFGRQVLISAEQPASIQ